MMPESNGTKCREKISNLQTRVMEGNAKSSDMESSNLKDDNFKRLIVNASIIRWDSTLDESNKKYLNENEIRGT